MIMQRKQEYLKGRVLGKMTTAKNSEELNKMMGWSQNDKEKTIGEIVLLLSEMTQYKDLIKVKEVCEEIIYN